MATVNKNFRIKNGLVVEGSTATVNGQNILTETGSDQYILNLIGGETLVKSVDSNLSVDSSGKLSINRGVVDSWYDYAGAASEAQAAAENYANGLASNYDSAGSAQSAYNNAVSYVDGEIAEALNTAQGYATDAGANANSYTDGREAAITTAYQNYADSLINDSSLTTTNVWSAYKTNTEINAAVSNLVASAPEVLDTLNELAAALADNPNYATDMAANLAAKQNTLTAGTAISLDNDTVSVNYWTGLGIDGYGKLVVDRDQVDTWYDPAGAAADALTTADFNATAALGQLINGNSQFTTVNIADVSAQVAATNTNVTGTAAPIFGFAGNTYRSAKLIVKIDNGTHSQISEFLVALDAANNIAVTEYAIVTTNGALADVNFTRKDSNGTIEVKIDVLNNYTVNTNVFGTLIK